MKIGTKRRGMQTRKIRKYTVSVIRIINLRISCCIISLECMDRKKKKTLLRNIHVERLSYHAGVRCFSPTLLGNPPEYLSQLVDEYLYVGANSMSPSLHPWNTPPSSSSFCNWSNFCSALQSLFLINCLAKLSSKYNL